MTREEKQLLLKDLCARLPYKCKYKASKEITHWHKLTLNPETIDKIIDDYYDEIKPYLRPISNITDEEKIELKVITKGVIQTIGLEDIVVTTDKGFDYLNAHHFDFRGLISKGLALEAPEGMYKEE